MKGVEFTFHSLEVDVTYILVLKKINDNFFDLRRYLTSIVDLSDEVFTVLFKSFLIIL